MVVSYVSHLALGDIEIPQSKLRNLRTLHYCCRDNSILSRFVFHRFWTAIAQTIPLNVAPNVLTLIGFFSGICSCLCAMLGAYDWHQDHFIESANSGTSESFSGKWWFFAALGLFCYQTFDALDGKQARRTASSSAVGDFFDHGCDAFLTPLFQCAVLCALGWSWSNPESGELIAIVSATFFFAAWDHYCTGELVLPLIGGATEGICIAMTIFLTTGWKGTEFWAQPLVTFPVVGVTTLRNLMLHFLLLPSAFLTVLGNVRHVALKAARSRTDCVLALVPFIAASIIAALLILFLWGAAKEGDTLPFVPLSLSYGLVCAHLSSFLNLARLSDLRPSLFSNPLLMWAAASLLCAMGSTAMASKWLTVVAAVLLMKYAAMLVRVLRKMANYLNMDIFFLKDVRLRGE